MFFKFHQKQVDSRERNIFLNTFLFYTLFGGGFNLTKSKKKVHLNEVKRKKILKKTKTGLLLLTSNQDQEYNFNNVLFFSSSKGYCNFIWLCQRQNMIWKKIKTINDMYSLPGFVFFFMWSHTMYALYIKAIELRQIETDLLAHI